MALQQSSNRSKRSAELIPSHAKKEFVENVKQEKIELQGAAVMAVFLALFILGAPLLFAQPLQKAVAMIGARSGASWPLWIAKDARLYAKYGLDVELVYAVHPGPIAAIRSEEHTSELQSPYDLVCRLLLEKKKEPKSTKSLGFRKAQAKSHARR